MVEHAAAAASSNGNSRRRCGHTVCVSCTQATHRRGHSWPHSKPLDTSSRMVGTNTCGAV